MVRILRCLLELIRRDETMADKESDRLVLFAESK